MKKTRTLLAITALVLPRWERPKPLLKVVTIKKMQAWKKLLHKKVALTKQLEFVK